MPKRTYSTSYRSVGESKKPTARSMQTVQAGSRARNAHIRQEGSASRNAHIRVHGKGSDKRRGGYKGDVGK